ncbi:MAG: FHA domain-containing protein, partial [Muribaculaceae bacterium]|nr:FHA domain-containing protein [Muribaculaceae bacterium]
YIPEIKKVGAIGNPNSVPGCVSRCQADKGIAHARLSIDKDGNLTLTNMKSENHTYVNGLEIMSRRITPSTKVELGIDRFPLDIQAILDAAKKLLPPPPQLPFDISHLEAVWNDFQTKKKEIQAKQKKVNLVRSGCGIFTMCAMPTIAMFGVVGYALTGIGILGNVYSFVGLKNDNTADIMEKLTEEFQEKYVCPNPDCNKFLGGNSYKFIKKQYSMHCPYCKCEYVEK